MEFTRLEEDNQRLKNEKSRMKVEIDKKNAFSFKNNYEDISETAPEYIKEEPKPESAVIQNIFQES